MLILGVTNPDIAAEVRVFNTLIGAGVGVAFNLIYPPAMPTGRAGRAVLRVAHAAAEPLDAAGEALSAGPVTREQIEALLDRVRTATRRVADAADAVTALKDSRPLNPRALGTVDVEPVLVTGLDTLEHCLLAIRSLFLVMITQLPSEEHEPDPYGDELRAAFAVVLHRASPTAFEPPAIWSSPRHEKPRTSDPGRGDSTPRHIAESIASTSRRHGGQLTRTDGCPTARANGSLLIANVQEPGHTHRGLVA